MSYLLALAIGAASGLTAFWFGMPLPWMLGSMIGVTLAAILSVPVKSAPTLRNVVIPAIGVMLGSAVTPETLNAASQWVTTLVLLPVFLLTAAGSSYLVYRKLGGYDPVTAYYSAVPGGLNEMLLMGEAAGGDGRRIALAHAARVLLVILFVALYFGLVLGVRSTTGGGTWIGFSDLSPKDYAILIACGVLGLPLAKLVRLPAAPIFGPMMLSAIAHLAGWVVTAPPTLVIITAQVVVGTFIGARFVGVPPRQVARDLGIAVPATLVMLAVAVAFAEALVIFGHMPLAQAFLAYSPGGLTEMSLLALAMDQDVAFVSITHIIRITLVVGLASAVFRLIGPRLRR